MANISGNSPLSQRDIFYFRHRFQNRVFQSVIAFFASRAAKDGLSKAQLATLLDKDPAQITRWFSGPGNWTLDTVSDLLLAMNAEMSVEPIAFDDYIASNSGTSTDGPKKTVFERDHPGTTGVPWMSVAR